jgi:hypothetical protein
VVEALALVVQVWLLQLQALRCPELAVAVVAETKPLILVVQDLQVLVVVQVVRLPAQVELQTLVAVAVAVAHSAALEMVALEVLE